MVAWIELLDCPGSRFGNAGRDEHYGGAVGEAVDGGKRCALGACGEGGRKVAGIGWGNVGVHRWGIRMCLMIAWVVLAWSGAGWRWECVVESCWWCWSRGRPITWS